MNKQKSPIPQGFYRPTTRHGNTVYTAGMTPRQNGVLMFSGKINHNISVTAYRDAVRLATANALQATLDIVSENEQIDKVLTLTVYIATDEEFQLHSKIADFASEYLHEQLGEAGIGARAAIGVFNLPGGAPVEVQLTVAITSHQ